MLETERRPVASSLVVIPITATQQNGAWVITDPGTTEVFGGDEISFALQGPGTFFMVVIMENQPRIFRNGQNQWFIGAPGSPTGDVTVIPILALTAKYHIFWTDGVNKAHLDPKVVVKPGGPLPVHPPLKPKEKG